MSRSLRGALAEPLLSVGPWVIDASGQTIQPLDVPAQPPGFGGATLPVQGVVVEVETGAATLAPVSSLTVVHQAL